MLIQKNLIDLLLMIFLMGAFTATGIHHLFNYLSNRDQKLSLIFCIWISLGVITMAIRFRALYNGEAVAYQALVVQIVEFGIACILFTHLVYENPTRLIKYFASLTLLGIVIYLSFPNQKDLTFGIIQISANLYMGYLLYKLYRLKKPYYNLIIAGSLLYGFAVVFFFGIGPLNVTQYFPTLSKVLLIASYLIAINLYSAYLTKLAAATISKLQENEFTAKNLQELDRLKTKFFSNITHEFRTPLTLIQGPAHELMEKTKDAESHKLLTMIKSNSAKLLSLINQLLDLSKLDAQEVKLNNKPARLDRLLKTTMNQFTSLAASREIQLEWTLPEQAHTVWMDEEKVETILINLISNALKFTPAGGKVVMDAIYSNNLLEAVVKDNGRGIPAEKLTHIFDRFYQVEATDSSHSEGTGIGLALVKEYVELMKGVIQVESEVAVGTAFKISIPLSIAPARLVEEPAAVMKDNAAVIEEPGIEYNELPLLLTVEDNEDIRSFIKTCLGTAYRYVEARHGREGLEKARHEIPDLIISDLMMPEMDGMQLCHEIKKDTRTNHIPFIMLTAKAAEESKMEGLQTGADDYLIKPFNKAELVLKVRNLILLREKLQIRIKNNLLSQATTVVAKSTGEQFIVKAKAYIEANLKEETLTVETLAAELALSREQCYRKIVALTGLSPSAFIRKLRLQKAAQLLAAKWGPVSQIAYEAGFENLSYFSKAFKEEFGKLPSEY
jgi:signal transduction histidine kinase/DNA-binding response OmpR family regulator